MFLLPQLPTPTLVADADRVDRNLKRMAAFANRTGMRLRPHTKTHKSPRLAARQVALSSAGVSVATIGEAEVIAELVDDIFIAYPLWAEDDTGHRVSAVLERARVSVGVDSAIAARRLAASLKARRSDVTVLVEVDSGARRSGVQPQNAGNVAVAAAQVGLSVGGVFTFAGHGYAPRATEAAAVDEAEALDAAAAVITDAGLPCPVRSGGSTPTASLTKAASVTEIRPGAYIFNDAQQVALGTCTVDDIALVAAATVISTPAPNRFVLNAGSKILGADRPAWVSGFGLLPDIPGATVTAMSEHHAVVTMPEEAVAPALGSALSIAPNHVCNAVNLVESITVISGGRIVDRWPVEARGRNR